MILFLPFLATLYGLATAATLPATTLNVPHRLIHQFNNGFWAENIAVRSNGKLLITMIAPYPQVYQLDPLLPNPVPELIATFPNHLAALGIDEIKPDVFAVVANNFTFSTGASTPGSNTLYCLDMRTYDTDGSLNLSVLAGIPDAVFLNGLTTIKGGAGGKVLIADSFTGQIFEVDVKNGASKVWIDDPILDFPADASIKIGVNGVRYRPEDGFVYFSVLSRGTMARVRYSPNGNREDNNDAKSIQVLAESNIPLDDFIVAPNGDIYATGGSDNVLYVVRAGSGRLTPFFGASDFLALAGPTAARFGRTKLDRHIIYVTTNGGVAGPVNGTITEPGKVVAIDTGRL
ncbi:uncharacterized protein LY79DRAFT_551002 [Colletotrichum navitas]|uniref:SMP-30/Gluconolactonase/LRE-like region domain-containing protein n=1 Tax=Colletotrichum navitas TaxID=681940 RepID=A0AAD8V4C8_9PEZI|nr:uncharacterized protein LY79DRAFT_551002 [Colletotrichum navitas]KAK1593822.1 hypothetical protein LY79DRAFT_551002 [Colletotrichum navitas]